MPLTTPLLELKNSVLCKQQTRHEARRRSNGDSLAHIDGSNSPAIGQLNVVVFHDAALCVPELRLQVGQSGEGFGSEFCPNCTYVRLTALLPPVYRHRFVLEMAVLCECNCGVVASERGLPRGIENSLNFIDFQQKKVGNVTPHRINSVHEVGAASLVKHFGHHVDHGDG